MKDFSVRNFMAFPGPNLYLDKPSMVFKLFVDLKDKPLENFLPAIAKEFPDINNYAPNNIVDLFCFVLKRIISKVEMIPDPQSKVIRDEEEWIIAVENTFDNISKQATFIVSDWFKSIAAKEDQYDMAEGLSKLNEFYIKAVDDLPVDYQLLIEARRRNLDVHLLKDENAIIWGYGKNQIRSKNLKLNTDGLLDFDLSVDSELLLNFLKKAGIPTPESAICYYENDLAKEVKRLGFPVVVKPVDMEEEKWIITGIDSIKTLRKKFNKIVHKAEKKEVPFKGIMIQQQFTGNTYRILIANNKMISALQILPASITGDGKRNIRDLIDIYNKKQNKKHFQIITDDDVSDFLEEKGLTLNSVPEKNQKVFLRKIANLNAGGQAISITDNIHTDYLTLFENISKYFNINILELDLIATDLSVTGENNMMGIIGINPDPCLTYHIYPFNNKDLDTKELFDQIFKRLKKNIRIPIITGNRLSKWLTQAICNELKLYNEDLDFGSIDKDGLSLNGKYFTNTRQHDTNCSLLFRNPKLDIALINHTHDLIIRNGTWHYGADMVILNQARASEYILMRDMLPGAILVEIKEESGENNKTVLGLTVSIDMQEIYSVKLEEGDDMDVIIMEVIKPYLKELLSKYESNKD